MSSCRNIRAVILGLLVLPGLVAGPAFASCSHQDPAPHPCCAMEVTRDTGGHGCCGSEAVRLQTARAGDDCSCSHAPEVPANPAAASSPAFQKDVSAQELQPELPVLDLATRDRVLVANPFRGPPPGHAPLFLLDCSLLI